MIVRQLKKSEVEEFIKFNEKVYPNRVGVEESIRFKLQCPDSETKEGTYRTLVTSNKDVIIGQLQLLPCIFFNKGEKMYGEWGMDFMVESEYRGQSFGVSMVKEAMKENHFGMGFAEKALKIHSFLGLNLIGYFKKFVYFKSPMSLISFLSGQISKKRFNIKKTIYPDSVIFGNKRFIVADDYSLFAQKPWNNDLVEFNRDGRFMKWRFGSYPEVFKTYICVNNTEMDSYFVVREVFWKGSPFLMLVDYRFKAGEFKYILKAVKKVLKHTKHIGIITTSTYHKWDKYIKSSGFWKFGKQGHITSNCKLDISEKDIQKRDKLFLTAADSDFDFFYGTKEWYQ